MKNIFIFFTLFSMIALFSCEKDEVRAIIDEDVPPPSMISPGNNYAKVIEEQDVNELITFVWEPVRYGVNTTINYTLEIDSVTRDFAGAVMLGSSESNSFSMTVGEFNTVLLEELGITPNERATLELRVISQLANSDKRLTSDPINLMITPWFAEEPDPEPEPDSPALWVAGDFQGWDVFIAPKIVSSREEGIYEGYIYIPEGGTNEFKLYGQQDWSPLSYGDGGDGTIIEHNDVGNNLVAPAAGYYHLAVNLNEMTYLLIEIETWGIIGDATPNGWDASTPMTFDPETVTWSITDDLIAGQFKIRANDEWVIDMGVDGNGLLRYENHPLMPYVEGERVGISEAGNYTFSINLTKSGNYTYSLQLNE